MAVSPIPAGFHTITPYLTLTNAPAAIDFLTRAFHAVECHRSLRPDGTIGHAQFKIGDSFLMLAEATEQWKPMPTAIYLYVPDVDATYQRALAAGGTSLMEPADMFYGDRQGGVLDPCSNLWWISTHVEDVAPDELERRARAALP